MKPADAVAAAARSLAKARARIDAKGCAVDEVWNDVERRENRLLRAVERFAGLKRGQLGSKDSR